MRRGFTRFGVPVLVGGLVLVAGACGGGGNETTSDGGTTASTSIESTTGSTGAGRDEELTTPESSGPPPAATGGGECRVTLTGDRDESWVFEQAVTSFSSDYWLSDEELRETVELLGEDISGGSYDELVARGEAVITLLQISCSDPQNLIQGALVSATNATRVTDLVMGPGSYPITGGLFDADGPAGTFVANLSVNEDEVYGTGPGSVEITRWDRDRIEGSFSFAAREVFADDPKEIDVAVEFSFVCGETVGGC